MQILSGIKAVFSEIGAYRKINDRSSNVQLRNFVGGRSKQRHSVAATSMVTISSQQKKSLDCWDTDDFSLDRLGIPVIVFDETPYDDRGHEEDSSCSFFDVI